MVETSGATPFWLFQSTPSHGGRPGELVSTPDECMFQSTPSCGGRPRRPSDRCPASCFNPRPRTEGDFCLGSVTRPRCRFQSTPSHGGRPVRIRSRSAQRRVSIHALAWRATHARLWSVEHGQGFNPRPHAEGDEHYQSATGPHSKFQSTPSCGGRQSGLCRYFGGRQVSIHALARRATRWRQVAFPADLVSTHALTRRATAQA